MLSAPTSLVPAIGWALLHFVWQGLLIGWGVSIVLFLLRKARPQARYAVACAGLLLCAALPLAGVIAQVDAAAPASLSGAGLGAALLIPVLSADAAQSGVAATLADDGTLAGWAAVLQGQLPWIVGLWLAGAVLMSLRLAIGLNWVAERTRGDRYTVNHYWQRRLSVMARRFGIARHVRLGVADLLDSPITAGCWRPIVLVPASLITGMAPDLLEALLAHELAHIKRRDYLVNLIQSAVEIVLFYHPSVWALSRRIRIEREQIADDLAVAMLGQPRMLAKALSELDKFQFDTTQLAHAAHGGNLMSRIKRLLRPDVEPVGWKMAVPLIGLVAASAVFYVHAAPRPPAAVVVPVAPAAAAAPAIPAMPAPPAAPAAPEGPVSLSYTTMTMSHTKVANAYAIVNSDKDQVHVSGNPEDIRSIGKLRPQIKGDFVWYRDGGNAWLIRDPAVLSKAEAVWKPVHAIDARMEAQNKQMSVHSKVLDGLSAQIDKLTRDMETGPGSAGRERLQRQMEALGSKQEAVGRRLGATAEALALDQSPENLRKHQQAVQAYQKEVAPLQKEMTQLQRDMAQNMARERVNSEPIRALSKEMAEANKPMAQLGRRMGELSDEKAKAMRQAELEFKSLMRETIRSGKAVPAPALM